MIGVPTYMTRTSKADVTFEKSELGQFLEDRKGDRKTENT